jgi:hypothetical protein
LTGNERFGHGPPLGTAVARVTGAVQRAVMIASLTAEARSGQPAFAPVREARLWL